MKKLLLTLLAIFFVFETLQWLDILPGKSPLRPADYNLVINNAGPSNPGAVVRNEGKGVFYIHTGERLPPAAKLKFRRNFEVVLDLTIRSSAKPGEIRFNTFHNERMISQDVVTKKTPVRIRVPIARGDTLRVSADKHGNTSADHGEIRVQIKDFNSNAKAFIVPFLWSLLLVLLISRNYHAIGFGSFFVFLLAVSAEKLNYRGISFSGLMAYMYLLFALAFLQVALFQIVAGAGRAKLAGTAISAVAVLAALVPANFVVYLLSFTNSISQEILYAVLQSDSVEAFEYVTDFYPIRYVVAGTCALIVIALTFYAQRFFRPMPLPRTVLVFLLLLFATQVVIQWKSLRIPVLVKAAFQNYHYEIDTFKNALQERESQASDFVASKKGTAETYVIVLGESLSKKHMSLYGYPRATTPLLSQLYANGNLLRFDNAYSNHTHTTLVMQKSLTEANLYNGKDYVKSLSILEVLNKAGFETHWLTNQVIYGPFDTITSVIASSAEHVVSRNRSVGNTTKAQAYDEVLVGDLQKVLSVPSDKNRAVFLHLSGNHSVYHSRYPKPEYAHFQGLPDKGILGEQASTSEKVNTYDNSVLYNDFVVSTLLKELQSHQGVTAFVYMPDHAEDVIGGLGHIAANFTFSMTAIPMLAWLSPEYQATYPEKAVALAAHTSALFSNDLLYDTVLGLAGVETEHYSAAYDISSKRYALTPEGAKVMNPRRRFTAESNTAYWHAENAKYLIDSGLQQKVFPHRVNSLAKLREMWADGLRSFEVDVRFNDDKLANFRVGHHKGVMGVEFEVFLESVDTNQIQRIWLDFKNLSPKNYRQAIESLELLDARFGLREKMIVESGTTHELLADVRNAGWHTSYYVPTKRVLELVKVGESEKVELLASEMASQLAAQNVNAVSFDTRVYPFVEKYLEPKLNADVVYHVWYGPDLADANFKQKLEKNELAQRARVKTVLVKYASQFHL